MRLSHTNDATRTLARRPAVRGFTIIELLVTVSIIILLAGLSVVALGRIGGTAREKATRGTIEKVNNLVRDRMQALDRSITKGELRGQVRVFEAQLGSRELAEIIARKVAYKQAFPQTFAETNGALAPANPTAHNPATESAEVLYWLVTSGGSFGYEAVGSDFFTANEVKDTDGDGLLEFVDGWEQSLRFYRWPTRLIRPGGNGNAVDLSAAELLIDGVNATTAGSDPDDPKGKIVTVPAMNQYGNEANFHTVGTYHAPLLVSGGPDFELGLYEPTDTTNFGHLAQPSVAIQPDGTLDPAIDPGDSVLADNITNRQTLGNE